MQIQKRTDTSFGNPVMGRREMTLRQSAHRERVHSAKSMIDTSAPMAQPHLTLYGRDYAAKKKATTEAAFMDLKMIQSIARTMTRKTEVEQRKGPVSLNADGRKAEIYRVMHENHRLLNAIENVEPMMCTADLIQDHREKTRYVINSSHTMRLSGEYDMEMARLRREDGARFQMKKQSTESRMMASKMRNTTGSVSLPSLTAPPMLETNTASTSQNGWVRHNGSTPMREAGQTHQISQSRSAGGLAGASKAAKAAAMNAQGEFRPSPGPPPQRGDQRDTVDATGVEHDTVTSCSSGSKDRPSKTAPKRVSKKPAAEPESAAATGSPPGKRASVSFTASDDVQDIECVNQDSPGSKRRLSRMGTPHFSKFPPMPDEEDAAPTQTDAQEEDIGHTETGSDELAACGVVDSEPVVDDKAGDNTAAEQLDQRVEDNNNVTPDNREMTAPEIEVNSSQIAGTEEGQVDEAVFVDEAMAAVQAAENSVGLEEAEVLANLSSALSGKKVSGRIRKALEANGWNGSSFDGRPDLPQLLRDLTGIKEELAVEANAAGTTGVAAECSKPEVAEAAKPDNQENRADQTADDDEYEDEFVDASADSLNMSRTLKSQDAPQEEAFESSATFEDHPETGEVA